MSENVPAPRRTLTREHAITGIVGIAFGFAVGFVVAWQLFGNPRPGFTDRNGPPTDPLAPIGMGGGGAPFLNPDGSIDLNKVPPEMKAQMEAAQKTLGEANAALAKNPVDLAALEQLAGVYSMIGQSDRISVIYRAALEAAPKDDTDLNVRLGNSAFDAFASDVAVEAYDRVLAKKPDDPDILTDSAICLLRMTRVPEAEERLRKAVSLREDHWQSRYYLAVVETFEHNNKEKATELLDQVEKLKPGFEGIAELRAALAGENPHGGGSPPPLAPGAEDAPLPPGHPPVTSPGPAAGGGR